MKKYFTTLFVLAVLWTGAQNLSTYGLLSNPGNIAQNPGADPVSKFYLSLPGNQSTFGLNQTAGTLFGSTDLLGNLASLNTKYLRVYQEGQIDLASIGIKLGKNFIYAGANAQIGFSADLDKDLFGFIKYGMSDANGDYDPNYTGDFSDLGMSMDIVSNYYLGFQRTFMDQKLRVGASYNLTNVIAAAEFRANDLNLISTVNSSTGINSLNFAYDLEILTAGIIDQSATIDSLQDIPNAIIGNGNDTATGFNADALTALFNTPAATSATFSFGLTYKPIDRIEVQASIIGLGASNLEVVSRGFSMAGSSNINGFSYTSQSGDSIASAIGNQLEVFQEEVTSSLNTNLNESNASITYTVPQVVNLGVNFFVTKRSYVGTHFTQRTGSRNDYSYLGMNGHWWIHKGLQVKGGYYIGMNDNSVDLINTTIQFRLSPLVQMHIGTSSVSPIATYVNANMPNGFETSYLGASTNGMNISAGITLMNLYDNRFKQERAERKAKKSSKSAEQKLTPAEVKKIEEAKNNSGATKAIDGGGN